MGSIGDLDSNIIGSNPEFAPIVDHSWLDVDLGKYKNYPSDNNPVRIAPKLSDLWSHSHMPSGAALIPNTAIPLRSSSEVPAVDPAVVIKETKQAIMSGLKGPALALHLKAHFTPRDIAAAETQLKDLSPEIGLLGNTYIDASAFDTYEEAEAFLNKHRSKLARDILIGGKLSVSQIEMLASTFYKKAVTSINYDNETLNKYRNHLILANRISPETVVSNKEELRNAFLYEKPNTVSDGPVPAFQDQEKMASADEISSSLAKFNSEQGIKEAELQDSINMSKISPVVLFVQKHLAEGKSPLTIKALLKSKFMTQDIKTAAEALSVVLSKNGLKTANIDSYVKEGKITVTLAKELKKIGSKYPVVETPVFEERKIIPNTGVIGYFYTPPNQKSDTDGLRLAAVKALKNGFSIGNIRSKLISKCSEEETTKILTDALREFNASPTGDHITIPKKATVIETPTPRKATLPDPLTIKDQYKDMEATFEGSGGLIVDVDPEQAYKAMSIEGLDETDGLDGSL
jgi:hypothetical protein